MRVLASHQCGPGATPGTTDAIMWLEFVVGSLPCFERVFSRYYGFPLSLKTNTSKFQFNLECTEKFQRVLKNSDLRAPLVNKLQTKYNKLQ